MAIEKLPVDFKNDIINVAVNPTRRYNMTENPGGTISLEDVTQYLQIGTTYGAKEINKLNETVNELIDESAKIDFVLTNQQVLNFISNVATIYDERITSDSLADVYFTSDTIDIAQAAAVEVETYNGYVTLTALRTPTGQIKATITIKAV